MQDQLWLFVLVLLSSLTIARWALGSDAEEEELHAPPAEDVRSQP